MFSETISKFDETRMFWEKIKKDSLMKLVCIQNDPQLALKLYDRFEDTELGEMFVKTYQNNLEYNEQAYFISVQLGGKPIPRISQSKLVRECEEFEKELDNNQAVYNNIHFILKNRKHKNLWRKVEI